jgi:plasmid stability protein
MPDLLIKNVPDRLRRRLKEDAKKHHRSMSGEALALLEKGLIGEGHPVPALEEPFQLPFRMTGAWLERARRQGRE